MEQAWDSSGQRDSRPEKEHMLLKLIFPSNDTLRLCALFLLTAYCSLLTANGQQSQDYARWVNPFIGTGGHGHTFPGATMPFGMVQLSPDTRTDNWDGSSGYHYSDDIIYGFSHTHLSGTGIPDYCDVLFMPTIGEPLYFAKEGDKSVNGYASKFSHAKEKAAPGYYSVKLDDDNILAEMTATARVGFHRYTFPQSNDANIILDLKWRDAVLDSDLKFVSKTRVEGYRRSSSWAKDQIIYFVAEFSKPFAYGSTINPSDADPRVIDHKNIKAAFRFKTQANEQILVKVALSPVSIEGARKNLAAELPGWNFDKVRADAREAWNKELSKIEVSGGTDDQTTTFYTALYHTMIQPNIYNDVDGSYRGHDGKIHQLPGYTTSSLAERRSSASPTASNSSSRGSAANERRSRAGLVSSGRKSTAFPLGEQYTVFSLWDTFRAAHPLYTIIDQKRTVDFINTFIRIYEQGGRLPVWELAGNETDCMIGYHAVSVIADAMAKGIKGFDYGKALAAAKHSAELDREGLAAYKRQGFISSEDVNESVSKTLEYAYDDWCISQMSDLVFRMWMDENERKPRSQRVTLFDSLNTQWLEYARRSRNFQNLFDPETRFFRPKRNGAFVTPFAPNEVTFNFTEGNSWVYSFFAPHDVDRLIELQGGREKFAEKLDDLFNTNDKLTGREQPDITGLIGQYAHGNEPSHHIAYLYDYAGQPSKTQGLVRKIMDEFYKPEPDGLIGNEDCGQMSAWYVLSASGFYSVLPGQTRYDFGTPLFPEIRYKLENGKTFTISAPNVSSKNIYIRSATLNGKRLETSYLDYADILHGGILQFEMNSSPNDAAFSKYSHSGVNVQTPVVPVIEGKRVFTDKTTIDIKTIGSGEMYWSMDSATEKHDWSSNFHPFDITETTKVSARSRSRTGEFSPEVTAIFYKRPHNWKVISNSGYSYQYTGGGIDGLVDGIRGTTSFSSGEWQGYQGKDFVATVDLQKVTQIKTLGAGFLQNVRSWIWMPTHIEFEYSRDGVEFSKIADIKTDVAQDNMDSITRDYRTPIKPVDARYVRIHAYSLGKIPSWHPGAGGNGWIFVDEILID